ncbi:acid protease [Nadsonia fulvescens var. elongata DSM 6958]|uniref:Acid protease n=1 Tax=Nadsonia fulvescens var. elongata DSM 6958 TaxID=857566 RepID=A0A1E3PDU1_9ASCO|nr:acid protease [Nadsonia fulvescens var. elongata DSM 6958]
MLAILVLLLATAVGAEGIISNEYSLASPSQSLDSWLYNQVEAESGGSLSVLNSGRSTTSFTPASKSASKSTLPSVSSSSSTVPNMALGVIPLNIYRQGLGLFTDLFISGQKQTFMLDTTSTETWIFDSSVPKCEDSYDYFGAFSDNKTVCVATTSFNTSQTDGVFQFLNEAFNVTYIDTSYASGEFASDNLFLPTLYVQGMKFGIVNDSSYTYATLGIGPNSYGSNISLVDMLDSHGSILHRAYSMFFDDPEQTTGKILFGGIMPNKFSGNIYTLPVSPIENEETPSKFFVTFTGSSVFSLSNGKSANLSSTQVFEPVLLDSTSLLTYLPHEIAVNLAIQLNAFYFDDIGAWVQSCSYQTLKGSLNIHFGEAEFQVPLSDLFYPITNAQGVPMNFSSGTTACMLAVTSSEAIGYNVLGASFLRNMYSYFDIDSAQVSLAQASFNSTDGPSFAIKNSLKNVLGSKQVVIDQTIIPTVTIAPPNASLYDVVKNNIFTTGVVISNGDLVGEYNINNLDASTQSTSTPAGQPNNNFNIGASTNVAGSWETIKSTMVTTRTISGVTNVYTFTYNLSTRTVATGSSRTVAATTTNTNPANDTPTFEAGAHINVISRVFLLLVPVILSCLLIFAIF